MSGSKKPEKALLMYYNNTPFILPESVHRYLFLRPTPFYREPVRHLLNDAVTAYFPLIGLFQLKKTHKYFANAF